MHKTVPFNELEGLTLSHIDIPDNNDVITFKTECGKEYDMYHEQDCCERVSIEDITGNIFNLIGHPIIKAEESTSRNLRGCRDGSCTWTFYKLATIQGWVDIRWYGESNGYYSESVKFVRTK